jgi:hypothetical protein
MRALEAVNLAIRFLCEVAAVLALAMVFAVLAVGSGILNYRFD